MKPQTVRILLIDDDEDDFILVNNALNDIESVVYELTWASKVEDAHKMLREHGAVYDVCLLDYNLGSITGLDFLNAVSGDYPHLPFVLLTGYGDREIDLMAMQYGISDYLSKERLDPVLLERTIRYAIERLRNMLQLQQFTNELKVKNRELDAYTRTIAHSLRNPLGLFTSFAGLIRMMDGENMSPDSVEMLEEIENQAHKLANMTTQLLLLSQVHDVSEVITEVDMTPIIADVIKRYNHLFREKKVQIELPTNPPKVMGHAAWLEEIMSNLVSNALKYMGEKNSSPQLTISAEVKGDHAIYQVTDNGIGIAKKDKEQLFEMFSRIRTQDTDSIDGSGLGLSVVRRLIERMNGEVGVESEPGKGSTFWFSLAMP